MNTNLDKTVKDIYKNFLKIDQNVTKIIQKIKILSGQIEIGSSDIDDNQENKELPLSIHKQQFNTKRTDPLKSITQWREKLPWEVIDKVQLGCKNSMEYLGYKYYSSEEEMLNDTSLGIFSLE